jgi:lysophospholipase L1-like esterase
MKTPPLLIAVFASFALSAPAPLALAQEAAPAPAPFKTIVPKIELQDGDTLVFLGDSITHQCLYTQYVEDYFYTRFPGKRLHFHNAGVGGDRAKDALIRFDEDVASFKPKFVTILLGMNDGSYTNYQQPIFDTYQKDMITVLDRIAGSGAIAVPMTPTMFDARAKRMSNKANAAQEPRDTYYNGVLALYGAWLREQADVRGLGFVDLWSPLNNLTMEQRKKDAAFTLIKDAVHPGPDGQVIMAMSILNDMVERTPVSRVTIRPQGAKFIANATNGAVTELQGGPDGISFTFAAKALPWVLPPDAAAGYKLGKAGHQLSAERFTVVGVKPGKHELKIDGQAIGTFTDVRLAAGVELEENEKTPQYQQALKVALLNKQRNDTAIHPLRDQWAQMKGRRNSIRKAQDVSDPEAAQKQDEFEQWQTAFRAKTAELIAKGREIEAQIYQVNQPVPHRYELTPVQ